LQPFFHNFPGNYSREKFEEHIYIFYRCAATGLKGFEARKEICAKTVLAQVVQMLDNGPDKSLSGG